jgi:hypothetical protein
VPSSTRETFDFFGYLAEVGAPLGDGHAAVRAILRGFGPVAAAAPPSARFDLTAGDAGEWQVRVSGQVVHAGDDFAAALSLLEWHAISVALGQRRDLFHLHSAALCLPARRSGLMLVGGSGRGKTTMTMGLMMRGFVPYSDDVALIEPETLELQPLRRAFHVADETWRLIESVGGPLARDAGQPDGYFCPPQWAEAPAPVHWLLFPEYRPGQTPALLPMSAAEAATGLLGQTLTLAPAPRLALRTAARLTEQARSYRFLIGELEESVELVRRLVAAAPSRNPRG